jgi:hypothetical protein
VSESRDRAKLGRAFDELMAGAVPAEAHQPVTDLALPTITSDDNDRDHAAADPKPEAR